MEHSTYKEPENLKGRLKESYDAMAPAYNAWAAKHSSLRMEYLGKLLELLPTAQDKMSFLELGCGAGVPVTEKLLSFPNFAVTANDLSSTQISLAKEKLGEDRVTWLESDMMGLSFPEASFDAVLAFFSLIHLPRDEQAQMLAKIGKWLKPGGYLLANFSDSEISGVVMEKWLDEKGWMFWSGLGVEKTVEKIREAGLEVAVQAVEIDDVDAQFFWVIARKQ